MEATGLRSKKGVTVIRSKEGRIRFRAQVRIDDRFPSSECSIHPWAVTLAAASATVACGALRHANTLL